MQSIGSEQVGIEEILSHRPHWPLVIWTGNPFTAERAAIAKKKKIKKIFSAISAYSAVKCFCF